MKEHALFEYRKLINYFDKLEILGIHLKNLVDNAKTDEDLKYLTERISEFHLMLTEEIVLRKISKEINELYDELLIDINNVSSDEDINNRIKLQLK